MKIDVIDYTIHRIISQLISKDLGQYYLIIFFSQKIIHVEIPYKTYNSELLAILKIYKR